ncbi:uncharacterized protein LOC120582301 isoform X3 [Pteropus medius]|uniref:uncharacterized protein LOC120582301 isoform X3 n=1 Tax=Pteropus vampyrus TaxID=132908 RepID=UPI00196B957D|nr:uncharacterized protein LOC120582301 isoform X3 [Pteropus giganteus]
MGSSRPGRLHPLVRSRASDGERRGPPTVGPPTASCPHVEPKRTRQPRLTHRLTRLPAPPTAPRPGPRGCPAQRLKDPAWVARRRGARTRSKMTSILRSPRALQLTLALIKPDAVAHPLILEVGTTQSLLTTHIPHQKAHSIFKTATVRQMLLSLPDKTLLKSSCD